MPRQSIDALLETDASGTLERVLAALEAEPNDVHRLAGALHCGRTSVERRAARLVEAVGEQDASILEPVSRRLQRVLTASEHDAVRAPLARTLPRLPLTRGEAGRLIFVFETWLEAAEPATQRMAMDAMMAMLPRRPDLAGRVRDLIERRAALGSPAAARHGRALLEGIKEF